MKRLKLSAPLKDTPNETFEIEASDDRPEVMLIFRAIKGTLTAQGYEASLSVIETVKTEI
jgi:hypothetical protein